MNHAFKKVSVAQINLVEATRKGWEDMRRGSGWSPTYESMSKIEQANYEIGRLVCLNVITSGQTPVPWKRVVQIGKTGRASKPANVAEQQKIAHEKIGNVCPNFSKVV
jgi:hypothetical protein